MIDASLFVDVIITALYGIIGVTDKVKDVALQGCALDKFDEKKKYLLQQILLLVPFWPLNKSTGER